MRTTVNLPEDVLDDMKAVAAERRQPLGAVMETALRSYLASRGATSQRFLLPTFGGGGLMPGVDLEDKERLAEILDDPA